MAELDLNKLSTSDLGYTVDDEDDDDPVLLDQDGNPVDTWRDRYPYDERLSRSQYEREQGQWYFQRYVSHLPGRGEMVLFDRSWYNRAGVEKVMGFCTPEEHAEFLRRAPLFEDMLVSDGISLTKLWFLGVARRAAHPVRDSRGRPGAAVEALADGYRVAGQMGRLHRSQGRNVRGDRYRLCTVDRREEQ
jgi:hypothetical protein